MPCLITNLDAKNKGKKIYRAGYFAHSQHTHANTCTPINYNYTIYILYIHKKCEHNLNNDKPMEKHSNDKRKQPIKVKKEKNL